MQKLTASQQPQRHNQEIWRQENAVVARGGARSDGNGGDLSGGRAQPKPVTATSYPFSATSAIALEDMSSGTTQLVAASQDDTASAVNNIGFDYWYDGFA
jgi:hypothetical protein